MTTNYVLNIQMIPGKKKKLLILVNLLLLDGYSGKMGYMFLCMFVIKLLTQGTPCGAVG